MVDMTEKKCEWCGCDMQVRTADVNRGWGKFCSKSCKAKKQEKKNGQYKAYMNGRGVSNLHPERLKKYKRAGYWDDSDPHYVEWRDYDDDTHPFSSEALGQWTD